MRLRLAIALAVAAIAVAACGSSGESAAPSTAPSAAGSVPAPTVVPSVAAPSAAASAAPSAAELPHSAPALEARLPDAVGGTALIKFSFAADDLQDNAASTTLTELIAAAGGDPASIEFALANNAPDGTFNVIAIRGDGVDGAKLLDAYVASEVAYGASLGSAKASLAGKDLIRLDNPDSNPVGDLWLYAVGDTIFGVQSTSESIIEEILGLLP